MSVLSSLGNLVKKALPSAIGLLPGGGTINSVLSLGKGLLAPSAKNAGRGNITAGTDRSWMTGGQGDPAGGQSTIQKILGFFGNLGGKVGLGKPGGLDLKHLLLGGGAGLGLKAARDAAGRRDKYLEEAVQRNRDEYAASSPVRSAARSQMLDRLSGMGGTPMPDVSGLADTANPFRKNFNFSLQAPGGMGAMPPVGPALPPLGPVGLLPPGGGMKPPPVLSGGGGGGGAMNEKRRKRERQREM